MIRPADVLTYLGFVAVFAVAAGSCTFVAIRADRDLAALSSPIAPAPSGEYPKGGG